MTRRYELPGQINPVIYRTLLNMFRCFSNLKVQNIANDMVGFFKNLKNDPDWLTDKFQTHQLRCGILPAFYRLYPLAFSLMPIFHSCFLSFFHSFIFSFLHSSCILQPSVKCLFFIHSFFHSFIFSLSSYPLKL